MRAVDARRPLDAGLCFLLGTALLSTLAGGVSAQARHPGAERLVRPGEFVHAWWTMEDGLPISHLSGVIQARDGYLWMSSLDGLIRFDGVRFVVLNTTTNPELPTNRFKQVIEGPAGSIWAAAEYDHVVRWTGREFDVLSLGEGRQGTSLLELSFDGQGVPLLRTNRGVFQFPDGVAEPWVEDGPNGSVAAVLRDRDGTAWFASDGEGATVVRDGELHSVTRGVVRGGRFASSFFEAEDGTVYIGTGRGVAAYADGQVRSLPSPADDSLLVRALLPLGADSALVLTHAGLFTLAAGVLTERRRDIASTAYGATPFLTTPNGDRWLANTDGQVFLNDELVYEGDFGIAAMTLDREGNLWLASDGLHRLKPAVFRTFGEQEGAADNVYPILEDSQGRIWLGSLDSYVSVYEDGEFRTEDSALPALVLALFEDRRGRLWIGQSGYGGCVMRNGSCEPIPFLTRHTVSAIHQDRSGDMWFGTNRGLYRQTPDGAVDHFSTADGLPHDLVRAIHEDRNGSLWLATNGGGVARLHQGRIESLGSTSGLSSDLIRAIHEDDSGSIWIGSEDRGLNRLELAPQRDGAPAPLAEAGIVVIRSSDGLFTDGIHTIVDDGLGRFWMSSNRGIFWVLRRDLEDFAAGRIERLHSISYTERDGLRNPEANGGVQSPAIRARDGRLWFAMQAGVAVVDPRQITGPEEGFPVRIEDVVADGFRRIVTGGDVVALEAGQRNFAVSYTALSFVAPENLRFQYRLEGLQNDWVDAENRRTAFFTNVPPGNHRFMVRATAGDGRWYEQNAPLTLTVDRFFYETLWFRLSALAAMVLMVLAGVRARETMHRRRARHLAQVVRERTATMEAQAVRLMELDEAKSRFFANVSHEFRTPLTLTIGPLEDVLAGAHGPVPSATAEQLELSLRNSRRLLRLVNQLLDVARLESGELELRAAAGDLRSFVDGVGLAFAPLAERRDIGFAREMPDGPVEAYFDPEVLEKVLMNLLSNAFKFTLPGGNVGLAMVVDPGGGADASVGEHSGSEEAEATNQARGSGPGVARIEVRDTGPGIAPDEVQQVFERFYRAEEHRATKGTGIGLSLASELAQLHGGRIEVDSKEGFGSTFTVVLPLGRTHLRREQMVAEEGPAWMAAPNPAQVLEYDGGFGRRTSAPADAATVGAAAEPVPTLGRAAAPKAASTGSSTRQSADTLGDDVTTILVVDDSDDVRLYLRRHLEGTYRVLEAVNGRHALDVARAHPPDLVVSDVMMPVMDGRELCRALKEDSTLDFVPVLLLTAQAAIESKIEALELGADDYLTKPFEVAELRARVDNLIASRRRLTERLAPRPSIAARPVEVKSKADAFVERLRDVIEERLADPDFGVDDLAHGVFESRSTLYRHLHDLGLPSAAELIRSMRLQRAAQLLSGEAGTVAEVAYGVGFRSVSHFSRSFKDEFGHAPSMHARASEATT